MITGRFSPAESWQQFCFSHSSSTGTFCTARFLGTGRTGDQGLLHPGISGNSKWNHTHQLSCGVILLCSDTENKSKIMLELSKIKNINCSLLVTSYELIEHIPHIKSLFPIIVRLKAIVILDSLEHIPSTRWHNLEPAVRPFDTFPQALVYPGDWQTASSNSPIILHCSCSFPAPLTEH